MRFGAAWLVVAFLFAQMVALGHQASVRHTTCAEHGELVDGGQDASPTTARLAIVAATGGETHDHDHCSIWSPRRSPLGHLAQAQLLGEVTPAPILAAALPSLDASTVAILRIAPKTSPPA
jgi:hypothetical protein